MRLWVFSNESYGYGEEICEACARYASAKGLTYKIVFSAKGGAEQFAPFNFESPQNVARSFKARIGRLNKLRQLRKRLGTLPVWVANVNSAEFHEQIQSGDIGIIAGFDQIFRPVVIDRFEQFINVHPSVLPLYRGPVPSFWCIKNKERKSGYTFHRVTAAIDSGDILYQDSIEIRPGMTPAELDAAISSKAALIVPPVLSCLLSRTEFPRKTLDAYTLYATHTDYAGFPVSIGQV
jgi:formyl transferase-like protein